MTNRIPLVAGVALLATTLSSSAALFSFQSGQSLVAGTSLTGTVTYEGWDNLTTGRIDNSPAVAGDNTTRPYGFHSLTNGWSATIAPNLGTSNTSTLNKTSGYGYIAGSSLHQGVGSGAIAAGGNFVVNTSAMTGLQTLVFQVQATDRNENVFWFSPVLTFGATTVVPQYSSLYATVDNFIGGANAQDQDSYAFQWDLTSYAIPAGTPLSVSWTGLTNSGIYQLQLNQGDTFAQVVPEPGMAGLLGLSLLGFLRRRRA